MKKNNNRSIPVVALLFAVLIFATIFTGCSAQAATIDGYEQLGNAYQLVNETNSAAPVSEQEVDCSKVVEDLQKQLDAANDALAKAQANAEDLKAENDKLAKELEAAEAEIEALKEEIVPDFEIVGENRYVMTDYFVDRGTIIWEDGTAALLAKEEGLNVILRDIQTLNERSGHREPTFMLPMEDGKIAITFDGKTVYAATFNLRTGKLEWSEDNVIATGYKQVEVQKDSEHSDMLKVIAACAENKDAEYEHDFFVIVTKKVPVKYYPPVQQQPTQPEQPETEQPETEQPETEQPETEQPETEKPETDKPEPKPDEEDPKNNSTNEGGDDMRDDDYSDILEGEQVNNSTNDGWQDMVDDLKQDSNINDGTTDDSCNGDIWQNGFGGSIEEDSNGFNDDTWLPSTWVDCDQSVNIGNSNSSNNGWEYNVSVSVESNVDSNVDSWTPSNTSNNGFADLIASFG